MPKLNPEHQVQLNKKSLREVLWRYNLHLRSFTIAKGGIQNTTFLITTDKGKFALRVYKKTKKEKDVLQELAFMNFLAQHKLPVPPVFTNNDKQLITQYKTSQNTWYCVLMKTMPGKHHHAYTPGLLKDLAKYQGQMHTLSPKFTKTQKYIRKLPLRLTDQEFLPKIKLNSITKKPIKEFLERDKKFALKLPSTLPRTLNHLDYDHANVLARNNKITAILDFDDLAYSPTVLDLGYTMWDVLYLSPTKMFMYLNFYSKLRKLQKQELALLKDILLFRNYIMGAFEVYFWGQNALYLPKILRLEKYILSLTTSDFEQAIKKLS